MGRVVPNEKCGPGEGVRKEIFPKKYVRVGSAKKKNIIILEVVGKIFHSAPLKISNGVALTHLSFYLHKFTRKIN